MWAQSLRVFLPVVVSLAGISTQAATFGTVVPIRGIPADIALDERRNALYIASLAGNRI